MNYELMKLGRAVRKLRVFVDLEVPTVLFGRFLCSLSSSFLVCLFRMAAPVNPIAEPPSLVNCIDLPKPFVTFYLSL